MIFDFQKDTNCDIFDIIDIIDIIFNQSSGKFRQISAPMPNINIKRKAQSKNQSWHNM